MGWRIMVEWPGVEGLGLGRFGRHGRSAAATAADAAAAAASGGGHLGHLASRPGCSTPNSPHCCTNSPPRTRHTSHSARCATGQCCRSWAAMEDGPDPSGQAAKCSNSMGQKCLGLVTPCGPILAGPGCSPGHGSLFIDTGRPRPGRHRPGRPSPQSHGSHKQARANRPGCGNRGQGQGHRQAG
jgi:hypothetical protein